MTESSQYKVAAVDRALLVLETLAESPRQGATEIATRLGLTKSLVFRLLATLEARGVVARDAEQPLYSLGHRIGVLGDRAGAQNVLLAAARPVMERLRDETSENVNLLVREGPQSLVVATLAGRHAIRIFAVAGRHGPLHAGGGSLLILAFAPEAVRERVLSAPIRDAAGEVVAALSVAGAMARYDEARRERHLATVGTAAEEISAKLAVGTPP